MERHNEQEEYNAEEEREGDGVFITSLPSHAQETLQQAVRRAEQAVRDAKRDGLAVDEETTTDAEIVQPQNAHDDVNDPEDQPPVDADIASALGWDAALHAHSRAIGLDSLREEVHGSNDAPSEADADVDAANGFAGTESHFSDEDADHEAACNPMNASELARVDERSVNLRAELDEYVQQLRSDSAVAHLPTDFDERVERMAKQEQQQNGGAAAFNNAGTKHQHAGADGMERIAELDAKLQRLSERENEVRAEVYPEHYGEDSRKMQAEMRAERNIARRMKQRQRQKKLKRALNAESATKAGGHMAQNAKRAGSYTFLQPAPRLSDEDEALVARILDEEDEEDNRAANPFNGDVDLDYEEVSDQPEEDNEQVDGVSTPGASTVGRARKVIERLKEIDQRLAEIGKPVDEIASEYPGKVTATEEEAAAANAGVHEDSQGSVHNTEASSTSAEQFNAGSNIGSAHGDDDMVTMQAESNAESTSSGASKDALKLQREERELRRAEQDIDRKLKDLKTSALPARLSDDSIRSLVEQCKEDMRERGDERVNFEEEVHVRIDSAASSGENTNLL